MPPPPQHLDEKVIATGGAIRFPLRVKLFLPIILAVLMATPLSAQDHEIVFHRPVKTGYRYDLVGKVTDEQGQKIEANGAPLRDSTTKTEAEIKARVEVTGVTKHEMPKSVRVEVREWSFKVGGKSVGDLKAGDTIEGASGGSGTFTVNGATVTKEEAVALGRLLGLKTEDETDSDDAVLGAGHAVKVGDAWLINATAGAKDLSESFRSEIRPEMLRGTVRLASVAGEAASAKQMIEAHITLNRPGVDVPGAPKGTKAKTFLVAIDVKTSLPEDKSLLPSSIDEDMLTEVVGEAPIESGGRSSLIVFRLGSRIVRHSEHTPVP